MVFEKVWPITRERTVVEPFDDSGESAAIVEAVVISVTGEEFNGAAVHTAPIETPIEGEVGKFLEYRCSSVVLVIDTPNWGLVRIFVPLLDIVRFDATISPIDGERTRLFRDHAGCERPYWCEWR